MASKDDKDKLGAKISKKKRASKKSSKKTSSKKSSKKRTAKKRPVAPPKISKAPVAEKPPEREVEAPKPAPIVSEPPKPVAVEKVMPKAPEPPKPVVPAAKSPDPRAPQAPPAREPKIPHVAEWQALRIFETAAHALEMATRDPFAVVKDLKALEEYIKGIKNSSARGAGLAFLVRLRSALNELGVQSTTITWGDTRSGAPETFDLMVGGLADLFERLGRPDIQRWDGVSEVFSSFPAAQHVRLEGPGKIVDLLGKFLAVGAMLRLSQTDSTATGIAINAHFSGVTWVSAERKDAIKDHQWIQESYLRVRRVLAGRFSTGVLPYGLAEAAAARGWAPFFLVCDRTLDPQSNLVTSELWGQLVDRHMSRFRGIPGAGILELVATDGPLKATAVG